MCVNIKYDIKYQIQSIVGGAGVGATGSRGAGGRVAGSAAAGAGRRRGGSRASGAAAATSSSVLARLAPDVPPLVVTLLSSGRSWTSSSLSSAGASLPFVGAIAVLRRFCERATLITTFSYSSDLRI